MKQKVNCAMIRGNIFSRRPAAKYAYLIVVVCLVAASTVRAWSLAQAANATQFLVLQSANDAARARKLSGTMHPLGDVDASLVQFSPDGHSVLYVADQTTDDVFDLYSVAIDQAEPVNLSSLPEPGARVSAFAVAPGGLEVVYLASQSSSSAFELYRVPIGGGPSAKLNGPLKQPTAR